MGGEKREEVENSEKQRSPAWPQIQREISKLPTHGFLTNRVLPCPGVLPNKAFS